MSKIIRTRDCPKRAIDSGKGAVAIMAVAAALALPFPTEAQTPKGGGTLNLATNQTINVLDANTTSVTIVRTMHEHTHGQLYVYDSKYALIADLADSHTISPDRKTWTFKLRGNVVFHDQSTLDAGDVVASWNRFVAVSPVGKQTSKGVTAVKATDPMTVVFEFEADPGLFLENISKPHTMFKIYPREIAEKAADRALHFEEMIGTGPYKFAQWERGKSLTMERFDKYAADQRHPGPNGLGGRKTAYLDKIVWHFVAEAGAHEAGLRSGRFDMADNIPLEMKESLEKEKGFTGTVIKPFAWINMMVNHHNAPMNDLRVRRAVQIGLDQSLIMLAAIGNPAMIRLSPGIAFDEQEWSNKEGSQYYAKNDKVEAKKLLAEAGYKGEPVTMMTTRTIEYMYKSAVVIQQELQSIGMNVKLEVMDWAALLGHITNKTLRPKWHLTSMGHSLRHDPTGWDLNFRSDQWTPHQNAEMDKWLDALGQERDFKKRHAAFANIQRIFHEDVVNIKHGDFFAWHAHRDYVKGYTSFEGFILWNVWLDK
ncbi:MAG: hypothetical protein EXQ95_11480 [Alphaproteobacteria bacterium]|nr:hypothetical protein [Alphaproteobacteria bacterium]